MKERGEMMTKIGILPNIDKDKDFAVTKRLIAYALSKDCMPMVTPIVGRLSGFPQYGASEDEIYEQADFLVSLGGDGTLLGFGRKAATYQKPIIGINLGTLGFLTAEEKGYAECAIQKVLDGEYKLENRMLLKATISTTSGDEEVELLALNDICISRGPLYKILEFEIYINDEYVDTMRADGVIVCTPTGSTAYNLSAGGPVMKADSEIIAITPIAAHTLNSRSIVVSATDVVSIRVHPRGDASYSISADGQVNHTMVSAGEIRITKAEKSARIIKTSNQGFYEILRYKLST